MISILYIDDEPGLLDLCRIFLESTGEFGVDTVESADEALARIAATRYDAVVSDFQMPGMNGIDLLKNIRSRKDDIPFILLTGRGREEVVIEALNNGADFYLQKGGDPKAQYAELMHKIRQAVEKRRAERDLRESEKRLTDIINFLPDATFAIDREGKVIAWNRAIEELTGIPAAAMLGKGDHEYAIPFYGHRRPILIDLLFEKEENIEKQYSGILREKDALVAESDLPRPRGNPLTISGKASPLYDRNGEPAGAIESIRDITARKQAEDEIRAAYEEIRATEEELRQQYDIIARNEQALKDSEEKYRTLVENNRDIIYLQQGDRILAINRQGPEVLEYTEQELLAMPIWELLHPEDRQRVLERNRARIRGEEIPHRYTARIVTKSGRVIPMELIAALITYRGEPAVMGIARDVTEHNELVSNLERKTRALTIINRIIHAAGRKCTIAELLDTALSSTCELLGFDGGGVYLVDDDGVHARVVRSLNLPEEVLKDTGEVDTRAEPYRSVFIGKTPLIGENFETVDPERSKRFGYLSVASIPLAAEDRVIGALNVASLQHHEIPADQRETLAAIGSELGSAILRIRAGEALQQSENKYRSIIENLQDMVYRTDLDGKITMISPAGAKRAGYSSPDEMIGCDLAGILYENPQDRRKFLAAIERKGSVTGYPLVLRDRAGQRYHVLASSHYYRDAEGRVAGIEGIVHDISYLRQTEDALREANRKLNLLNNITRHDVTNQLTVLEGYVQLAMIKNPDPLIADFLVKIDTVTATIGRQIEFSKTYQELGGQAPDWFVLEDILAKTRPKEILFSTSCTGVEVYADPMLEKVFLNLFGNAVMHGERVTQISVTCEPVAEDLVISVQDNGVGIPLDLKQKIFRKGFGKNTGFGLFLSREILGITGIMIHETGTHGKGARFEITVPKSGFRKGRQA